MDKAIFIEGGVNVFQALDTRFVFNAYAPDGDFTFITNGKNGLGVAIPFEQFDHAMVRLSQSDRVTFEHQDDGSYELIYGVH
ncbi:hypothetical protein [Planctobacterium marinum]|uniref:hypothetical protein n=1 Tax=Planctobacterium marinum TaxID=1631968 RepID=UPI001E62124B|nr:hypothetical protein [Planctobacterium marinum]MCC2604098.1 hypothetical protein [Planctobacterium marinum]